MSDTNKVVARINYPKNVRKKMTFKGFCYLKDKDWIFLIPTVVIQTNDPRYIEKSLLIAFHFLIWHFRWYWRGEVRYDTK